MHSFTQEDLILFMYGETSQEKKAAIKAALDNDWDFKEQYELLVSAQQNLKSINLSPRKNAVDFIMNYAAKSAKKQTTEV
jgi:hypothetical protein